MHTARLQYDRIIITGASSGFGEAFAGTLAPHTEELVLIARNEAALRQLAAARQEVKKQIADDGKTIRVRDGIQALELLAELGISSVPADGVRLSRGSLTIVVTRGKKEDGVFYVLAVKEEGGASLEVKMVPPS